MDFANRLSACHGGFQNVRRVMMVLTVCGCLVAMGPASGQVFWPGVSTPGQPGG